MGFSILTHRASDFRFIIDNVNKRLSNCKTQFLLVACRATLVQTTLNALPNHVMQYTILPKAIHNQIDKIQRDCLWGSTFISWKIYCINWDTVTLPKKYGGLGLRKATQENTALIVGLTWRLFTHPSSLLANFLTTEYVGRYSNTNYSFIWSNILT